MNKAFLNLTRPEMNLLFEFQLRKLQMVDGLWFLNVEERFGNEKAIEINCAVWGEVGRRDGRKARTLLGVKGEGLPALRAALQKTFVAFADWEMEEVSDTHWVLRTNTCYPQKARLLKGKGVYDCRSTEQAFFSGYARGIDCRLRVQCGFCPPEKYFEHLWCEWHFYLDREGSEIEE